MERAKRFWNWMADKYSKSDIKDMEGYEKGLADTRKYLKKTDSVLEIGCGTGMTALKLASSVDKYTATDLSENMISIGKERTKKENGTNITFLPVTVFDEKLDKNSFNAVMAYNLFHLLKDRDKAMKRINELLKPGGVFISKTPCLGGSFLIKFMAVFLRIFIGPIQCFTVDEFKKSLSDSGFEIVEGYEISEKHPRYFVVARKH